MQWGISRQLGLCRGATKKGRARTVFIEIVPRFHNLLKLELCQNHCRNLVLELGCLVVNVLDLDPHELPSSCQFFHRRLGRANLVFELLGLLLSRFESLSKRC